MDGPSLPARKSKRHLARLQGPGFQGLRVKGSRFRAQGLGLEGFGFRVWG